MLTTENSTLAKQEKRKPQIRDKKTVSQNTIDFINAVFSGDDPHGYVRINCANNKKGIKVPQGKFCSDVMPKYLNSDHLDWYNRTFCPSTFYNKKIGTENNIRNVNALCLKLSIHKGGIPYALLDPAAVSYYLKGHEPEEEVTREDYMKIISIAIMKMMDYEGKILPQYAIVGEDIILMFLFKEPVFLKKGKKDKKNMLTLLHKVADMLADRFERALLESGFFDALDVTPMALNECIHMPQSKDAKYLPVFEFDEKIQKTVLTKFEKQYEHWTELVPIDSKSACLSLPEMVDALLPKVADWYDSWQEKKNKPKPFVSLSERRFYIRDMLLERIKFLEKLQELGYEDGRREYMCFLYSNFLRQLGVSLEESIKRTKTFNRKFKNPLFNSTIDKIWSEKTAQKTYNFTNEKLLEFLNLSVEDAAKCGLYLGACDDYNRRYQAARYKKIRKEMEKKGQTKRQRKERAAERALKLREEKGLTLKEIGKRLHVSLSTVKRYLKLAVSLRANAAETAAA